MGFREGAFATVWEVTSQGDNFSKVRIGTSRKDKESGEYTPDFSGFVSLIGEAHKKLNIIQRMLNNGKCRIKLGSCDVTNRYDKEAGREYVNFTLFDFEPLDGSGNSTGETTGQHKSENKKSTNTAKKSKASPPPLADDDDDEDEDDGSGEELPF